MKINKKKIWVSLMFFIMIISFTTGVKNISAHDPRYIDLKYYEDDQVLSVYIVHGISNSSRHYINKVKIEFCQLPDSLIEEFTSDPSREIVGEGEIERFGTIKIKEEDVFDVIDLNEMNKTLKLEVNYTSQAEDLIIHYNYTIECPEWTLVVVTAYCNMNGSFTQTLISGHPWYDPEHHIIEAVVPTLVCSVIVMIPLVIRRTIARKRQKGVKH
ncbi:MAG: hypothetical protein DRO88_07045 [Promethearchaeia archaeon]|nr:MAG: hypothetical protein DRO88_07045 [Candidatus Lokiarchaeia archaeon]